VFEVRSPHTGQPTVYLYERAPGGVGLAERLFRFHDHLIRTATGLVESCGCAAGCPSCVGPVLEVGSTGKQDCLSILRAAQRDLAAATPIHAVPAP